MSYYPVPSAQIQLQAFPKMKRQNHPYMHRTVRQETTKFKAGTLPLNMYETPVYRGERLVFAPNKDNEDNEVERDNEREDGRSSRIYKADQLSEYDDVSSDDNVSTLAEDGAEPQLLNKELEFLFTTARRSARTVRTSNKAVLLL